MLFCLHSTILGTCAWAPSHAYCARGNACIVQTFPSCKSGLDYHRVQHCYPLTLPPPLQARSVGMGSTLLEVSGTLEVYPRRTILVPASLLLPETIPIRATLQIGVNGPLETGDVELVVAKWVRLWTHAGSEGSGCGTAGIFSATIMGNDYQCRA